MLKDCLSVHNAILSNLPTYLFSLSTALVLIFVEGPITWCRAVATDMDEGKQILNRHGEVQCGDVQAMSTNVHTANVG